MAIWLGQEVLLSPQRSQVERRPKGSPKSSYPVSDRPWLLEPTNLPGTSMLVLGQREEKCI